MQYCLGNFNQGELKTYRSNLEVFVRQFPNGFLVERGHREDKKGFIPFQTQGALPVFSDRFELDKAPFAKPNPDSRVFYLEKVMDNEGKPKNPFFQGVAVGRDQTSDVCLRLETIASFQAYYTVNTGDLNQPVLVDVSEKEKNIIYAFVPDKEGSIITYRRVTLPKGKKVKLKDKCIILFGGREGFAFQFYLSPSYFKFLNEFNFI